MKLIDLKGQTFGHLYVEGLSPKRTPQGYKLWRCRCECGGSIYAQSWELQRGRITSCGCENFKAETSIKRRSKHHEPAIDCFAYDNGQCIALKELVCVTKGKCVFWSPKEK